MSSAFDIVKFFKGLRIMAGSALDAVFPRTCRVCGRALGYGERLLCLGCMADLPRTGLHEIEFNTIHQRVAGNVAIDLASGWFYYFSDSPYAGLIREAKYDDMPSTARCLGHMYGRELAAVGYKGAFDVLLPVPLHRDKLLRRGYNQSLEIARGLAAELDCDVGDNLVAVRAHRTQTSRSGYERFANGRDSFDLRSPIELNDLRVAVVDDVITTGSTIHDCVAAIARKSEPASVSVLSIGVTKMR